MVRIRQTDTAAEVNPAASAGANPGEGQAQNATANPAESHAQNATVNPGESHTQNATANPAESHAQNATVNPGESHTQNATVNPGEHHTPNATVNPSESHPQNATLPALEGAIQLLNAAGQRVAAPGYEEHVLDIGHEQLRGMFEDMTIIRRLDTEATALQRQGQLALWPPLRGQEAAQIASAKNLRADDFVFSSYREHGVAYCRGARPIDLVRVWRGTAVSGWNPHDINMAPAQVIIGAQGLHATGYAMGIRKDGADSVAIAYFGDGAMSEGDVSEAMVFAASFKAPVIFFVQNNQWAISEPVRVQTTVSLADRGPGFGIPSMRVDGNDVLAVAAATRIALDRARRGDGPTLIEAVTYRMGPHTTADDPTRYRPAGDLEVWGALDPIARLEALLVAEDALSDEFRARVAERADAAAAELRAECIALEDPPPLGIFDHVYAAPHARLDEQRAAYAAYLEGFES